MELHGNYDYVSEKHPNYIPDNVDIATATYFFKRYKVLFSAVWENVLDENILSDFLRGNIDLKETIRSFENVSKENQNKLNKAENLKELEKIVRENNIFNMND